MIGDARFAARIARACARASGGAAAMGQEVRRMTPRHWTILLAGVTLVVVPLLTPSPAAAQNVCGISANGANTTAGGATATRAW
jgi:hypothetical protein